MFELLMESVRVSLDTLKNNKLRSFLTTLGIIIGVMTVIIVVSIIAGLQAKVESVFSTIGSNVIYIERHGWVQMGADDWRKMRMNYVDMDDYRKIKEMMTTADAVGVSIGRMLTIKYKGNKLDLISVSGITENGLYIENYKIDAGIPFSEDDIQYKRNVCLIGKDIREKLFENENPIGKYLTVDGKKYLIQGILAEKGSIFGQSMDQVVLIPYTVMTKYYGEEMRRISIEIRSSNPEETIE